MQGCSEVDDLGYAADHPALRCDRLGECGCYLLYGQVVVGTCRRDVLLAISLLQRNGGEAALRGGLLAVFLGGVIVARLLGGTPAND
jgi:hypothetical protein